MSLRIAIGSISHETNTFAKGKTDWQVFSRNLVEKERLISHFKGTRDAVGGFLDAARDFNFDVVPLASFDVYPSATIEKEVLIRATQKLVDDLKFGKSSNL